MEKLTFGEYLNEEMVFDNCTNVLNESGGLTPAIYDILKAINGKVVDKFSVDKVERNINNNKTAYIYVNDSFMVSYLHVKNFGDDVIFVDISDAMKRGKKLKAISVKHRYYENDDLFELFLSNIEGVSNINDVIKACKDVGIEYMSLNYNSASVFNPWVYKKLKAIKSVGKRPTKAIIASMVKNGQYKYIEHVDGGSRKVGDSYRNGINLIAKLYPGYNSVPSIKIDEYDGEKVIVVNFHTDIFYVFFDDLVPKKDHAVV